MENNFDFIKSELKIYENNGLLIHENGTILIGKAPHIAPMAWLHSIYQGLEIVDIKTMESELSTEIPKDYADFLTFSNGLNLFNTALSLFGKRANHDRVAEINARQPFALASTNLFEKPLNSKENYFYIGSYDWDGSLVFIDKSNNKAHRCEREDAEIFNSWSNFSEFLKSEIVRLKLLHNENGTEKSLGKSTLPD